MLENLQNKKIEISVVIPVKNGIDTIKDCINAILTQTLIKKTEIIIIDSGSTDGTLDILLHYPVRLYHIPPEDFNHGSTRNYGASLALGEFVVMTVQDAKPADDYWLEKMIRHFNDPLVAGVCGQQIVPHKNGYNPHQWFRPQGGATVSEVWFPEKTAFENLSPLQKRQFCAWDDVNAMYRNEVLLKLPFLPVNFSEDALWARDALQNGFKLIYDTNSRVEHYHYKTPEYIKSRIIIEEYLSWLYFGCIKTSHFRLKDYLLIVYRNFKFKASIKWIFHNWMSIYFTNKTLKKLNRSMQKGEQEFVAFCKGNCKSIPQGKIL